MGCIKPPKQVTQPTVRAGGRLALTPGSGAGSQWVPAGSLPPDAGVIFGEDGSEHLVSFKAGKTGGTRDGHVLIADGDLRDDAAAFDANHNHYGPDSREPGGTFAADRGAYTGPDH